MQARATRPMPYDWPRLLEDIAYQLGEPDPVQVDMRVPVLNPHLAYWLDVPLGTLRGWIDGARPKHEDGELILDYWSKLTGKGRIFAHRTRRSLTATER